MVFRDDLGAARVHVDALQTELARLGTSSAATEAELAKVRAELVAAQRELSRLSALEPGSAARRRAPYRTLLFVALGLVLATAVAGYHSESFGMTMSYFAAVLLGIGCAGWIGARRSHLAGALAALFGALAGPALLHAFYSSIWPSL